MSNTLRNHVYLIHHHAGDSIIPRGTHGLHVADPGYVAAPSWYEVASMCTDTPVHHEEFDGPHPSDLTEGRSTFLVAVVGGIGQRKRCRWRVELVAVDDPRVVELQR